MSRAILREPEAIRPWAMAAIHPALPDAPAGSAPTRLSADPVELVLAARAQAEELLRAARDEAAAIVEKAREEADRHKADAYREGFADGVARGMEEWSDIRTRTEALALELPEAYSQFCESQVPNLAKLATQAAELLLKEQLTLEPERITVIVQDALRCLNASTNIRVHLNPEDLRIVRHEAALQEGRQFSAVEFVADEALHRGGCWIESEQGQLDASVEGRIERMALLLEDAG